MSILEDGIFKAAIGVTTLKEVSRVVSEVNSETIPEDSLKISQGE